MFAVIFVKHKPLADCCCVLLQFLVELGVSNHLAICTSIAEVAAKEHSFERNLEKMRLDWSSVTFDLLPSVHNSNFICSTLTLFSGTKTAEHT
jgi:hypothetical protein